MDLSTFSDAKRIKIRKLRNLIGTSFQESVNDVKRRDISRVALSSVIMNVIKD